MSYDEAFKIVKEAVEEELGIDVEGLNKNTEIADEITLTKIIMNIEMKYDFDFSNEEIEKIKKVGDIVDFILKKQ